MCFLMFSMLFLNLCLALAANNTLSLFLLTKAPALDPVLLTKHCCCNQRVNKTDWKSYCLISIIKYALRKPFYFNHNQNLIIANDEVRHASFIRNQCCRCEHLKMTQTASLKDLLKVLSHNYNHHPRNNKWKVLARHITIR